MEIRYLNMYQRLRDFNIPSAILDEIFGNKEELKILCNAWDALKKDNFTDDQTANEIAKIIKRDLNLNDQIEDLNK
jgi:hypothetical protein